MNTTVDDSNRAPAAGVQPPKKRIKKRPRALAQIKAMQQSTNLLIPKKRFARLVREIAQDYGNDFRFQKDAILALQEASEAYIIEVFKGANTQSIHAGRVGVNVSDWKLAMDSESVQKKR